MVPVLSLKKSVVVWLDHQCIILSPKQIETQNKRMQSKYIASALASWYAKDSVTVDSLFQHLTSSSLAKLQEGIQANIENSTANEYYEVIAKAALRRITCHQLKKYEAVASKKEVEAALKFHSLPTEVQKELHERYGGKCPPTTWWESLERLRTLCGEDSVALWKMVLEHPMTAYVPMQCQSCGHIVPDVASTERSDLEAGLCEVDPTDDDELLELRGGWFRGRPRPPKIFELRCPECSEVTSWYRSGHPKIILNPHRWGRLCGEQEDLRLALANYLWINIRMCIPLDWDHIWSEFSAPDENRGLGGGGTAAIAWHVLDDDARNFAVRLDKGIGSWTGVLAIHPDAILCEDLTCDYLQTKTGDQSAGGRVDQCHAQQLPHYQSLVEEARKDPSGSRTQVKTVLGYILNRSRLTAGDVTNELRKMAGESVAGTSKSKPTASWWLVQ